MTYQPPVIRETQHTILVALTVTGEAGLTRGQAQYGILRMLPRPGEVAWAPNDPEPAAVTLDSWWVAEDDRIDGSDCDSAVFVTPGAQQAAYDLLHDRDLTPDCNDPSKWGGSPGRFEAPGQATPGIYIKEVPANHPAFEVAMSNLPDDVRLPHPDVPCAWCGEFVMDENACPNAKDICNDCCGED